MPNQICGRREDAFIRKTKGVAASPATPFCSQLMTELADQELDLLKALANECENSGPPGFWSKLKKMDTKVYDKR
jgi:hypothetical protein